MNNLVYNIALIAGTVVVLIIFLSAVKRDAEENLKALRERDKMRREKKQRESRQVTPQGPVAE